MNRVYQQAIKDIESSGGNYGLMGPVTRNGDRAYGAYQVMGRNIPEWTRQHYGTELTPEDFLQNKDAQDAVFNGQFGSYVDKYGNPQDAASAWFTGRPLSRGGSSSDGYITGNQYVDRFNNGLAKYGDGSAVSVINNAAGIKPPAASGALSFAGNEDDEPSAPPSPALSTANTLGSGALTADAKGDDKWGALGQTLTGIGASLAGISNPDQAKVLAAQAASMQKAAVDQGTWSIHTFPNGQSVLMNNKGRMVPLQGNYAAPEKDPREQEAAKLEIKRAGDRYEAITTADRNADEQLAKLDKLEAAVKNPDIYFGPGGDQVVRAKQVASALGLNVSGLTDAQIVQRMSTEYQLSKGKMLPGAISNYEDQLMSRGNGLGLDKSREANLDAIATQRAILKHQKAAAAEAYKYAKGNKYGVLDDKWEPYINDWNAAHGVQIPTLPQAAPATASPQTNTFKTRNGVTWSY